MPKIRLAKFIADSGLCSRRQASRLIDQGVVLVNHARANHIDHVDASDDISVFNQPLPQQAEKVYYAFYKPIGIDSKVRPDDPASIYHLLPKQQRVYPVGRLDKDSHGLLLLTNDGQLCQSLNHPDHHQEKQYQVKVSKPIDDDFCQKMAQGVFILQQTTRPCVCTKLSEDTFSITLKQGLNRQIRRMAKALGYYVIDLKRERIAKIKLNALNLAPGEYQEIEKKDIVSMPF